MDDWLLDELVGISKSIYTLGEKCEKIDLELKAMKEILYLLLEHITTHQSLEMDAEFERKLMTENIGIISPNKRTYIDWITTIVEQSGRNIKIIDEAVTKGVLGAHLNSLGSADFVFINCVYLSGSKELIELLHEAIFHNRITIEIGKANNARTITIDLPIVHYILYAPDKRMFLPGLIKDENIYSS